MPHKDPEAAKAWRREWWKRDKSNGSRQKQKDRARIRRNEMNEYLRAYKVKAGCADCGYRAHHVALEFHHEGEKELNVSLAKSLAQAKREMLRCVVLCCNCHRIRHWDERHNLTEVESEAA
jgi:hypothetical protein